MKQQKLIQIADEPADIQHADRLKLIGPNIHQQIPALSYLIAGTKHGTYFCQTRNSKIDLNISARNEFDPASLSGALKVLNVENGYAPDAIWNTAFYYEAEMLAHRNGDGQITAVTTRPGPGTEFQLPSIDEICLFTGLPPEGWTIGKLAYRFDDRGESIPVRINGHILNHHLLVGGTTGMGKTNALANIIEAAQSDGRAVIVFDHKPDYVSIDQPNPEHENPRGIKKATFWTLGPGERKDAIAIKVQAGELPLGMLAHTIFWKHGEDLQAEAFDLILNGFDAKWKEKKEGPWSWDEFLEWFRKYKNVTALAEGLPSSTKLNDRTFGAMYKIDLPGRLPTWVDSNQRNQKMRFPGPGESKGTSKPSDFFEQLQEGSVHVIRVDGDGDDSRSYGLFLDYALGEISKRRRAGGPKIQHIIDEAADIFRGGNEALRKEAVAALTQHIRKGRSLKIGFVLSVQSAGDVPEEIRQNLNSIIVFKHKNPSVLHDILPERKELFSVVNNLNRGEALIHLFGVRSLLHASMDRSPFKLYDPDDHSK